MRDRDREYARAKYAADPENSRARSRAKAAEWRVAHPDYDSVQGRRNYAAHSEKMRESVRIWRAAHPEECRAFHTRYKARKLGNGGRHTADAWRALVAATGSRCAYCGAAGDARTFHVEHRVPIARAGCDCIANVAPSCEPCNLSKGRLTDREYVERRRREGKRVRVAILRRPYCLEHFAREAR